jgi:hypothetical protein
MSGPEKKRMAIDAQKALKECRKGFTQFVTDASQFKDCLLWYYDDEATAMLIGTVVNMFILKTGQKVAILYRERPHGDLRSGSDTSHNMGSPTLFTVDLNDKETLFLFTMNRNDHKTEHEVVLPATTLWIE